MKRVLLFLSFVFLVTASVPLAYAVPILSATTITSGSDTFTFNSPLEGGYSCQFTVNGGTETGNCANVSVAAGPGNGIVLTSGITVGGGTPDLALQFIDSSTTPITNLSLSMTDVTSGTGFVGVMETVYNAPITSGGMLLATLEVCQNFGTPINSSCTNPTLSATATVPGSYTTLYIYKDNFFNVQQGSVGDVTSISQTYALTPEPASLGLIGGGLMLFGFLNVRRLRKS